MKVERPPVAHTDERGTITDILVREPIEHVTVITSRKGTHRGSHYHKQTMQWVYLIKGRMQLLTQSPEEPVVVSVLEPGDLALTPPLMRHAMIALEDSVFMVFTRGPRGGENYEDDTFRLPEPLRP
ncbi:MAG: cupin domain-containing protein [Elusimicrobia bacterium]|nr:cupin domain-containing protein [Elusimicrobiota bacterium]